MMNNLDPSLVNQCFEFVQSMAAQKVGHFSLKLTIGQSQFFFDSRENTSARTPPVEVRQNHLTPSKTRRNARRREQFLRKKLTSPTSPAAADSEASRSGGGQSEREASGSGDKITRLKSREEGRKFSYLTRRISALAQQTELNQRCIGVMTSWQPFDSRKMAEYGIEGSRQPLQTYSREMRLQGTSTGRKRIRKRCNGRSNSDSVFNVLQSNDCRSPMLIWEWWCFGWLMHF